MTLDIHVQTLKFITLDIHVQTLRRWYPCLLHRSYHDQSCPHWK